jgi:hypothetical protein
MKARSGLLLLAGLLFTSAVVVATGYNYLALTFGIVGSIVLALYDPVSSASFRAGETEGILSGSRKWIWLAVTSILIVFTVVPVMAYYAPPATQQSVSVGGGGASAPSSVTCPNPCIISIKNSQFGTGSQLSGGNGYVVVKAGTQVIWKNDDNTQHTTTSDTGIWDSGIMNPGQSFSFTFTNPGTYSYFCNVHPMVGVVVVVP